MSSAPSLSNDAAMPAYAASHRGPSRLERREARQGRVVTAATRIGRFAQVAQALTAEYGFSRGNGKNPGHQTLLIDDKVFAWSSVAWYFVVRLPTERVDALVSAGTGRMLTAGGQQTPDWLVVHGESFEEWLELAREAMRFVRRLD